MSATRCCIPWVDDVVLMRASKILARNLNVNKRPNSKNSRKNASLMLDFDLVARDFSVLCPNENGFSFGVGSTASTLRLYTDQWPFYAAML